MTNMRSAVELDMGSVSSRAFEAISGNFLPFFMLAFLFAAIPSYAITMAVDYFNVQLMQTGYRNLTTSTLAGFATGLVISLPSYIAIGAITHGCMITFNDGQPDMGDCIATGVRKFIPLFVLGFLANLAILLGLVVLIVPGIIVAVALIVAAPALVVEKGGVFRALSRSNQLTESNRWRIFWLCVAYLIAYSVIIVAQTNILNATLYSNPLQDIGGSIFIPSTPMEWTGIFITLAIDALTTLIGAAGVASIYYELRTGKEGATSDELAKVFE